MYANIYSLCQDSKEIGQFDILALKKWHLFVWHTFCKILERTHSCSYRKDNNNK